MPRNGGALWTEENLSFDGAWWATFVKVFADQPCGVILNSAVHHLHHESTYGSAVTAEEAATCGTPGGGDTPSACFVHTLTFSRIIPQGFKLLWVDRVEAIWVTILERRSTATPRRRSRCPSTPRRSDRRAAFAGSARDGTILGG